MANVAWTFSYTRKGYFELFRDGAPVIASSRSSNRHTSILECGEHASEHAAEIGSPGEYEVRIDGGLVGVVRIRQVTLDHTVDPVDEPAVQGELALGASSYTTDEQQSFDFTIVRTQNLDEVVSVDWAVVNASVSPLSGTETFQIGDDVKTVTLTAGDVLPSETGEIQLSNPQNSSGGIQPAIVAPQTASLTINSIDAGQIDVVTTNIIVDEQSTATIELNRSNGSRGQFAVDLNITGLSAAGFSDQTVQVVWADGESGVKTYDVPLPTDISAQVQGSFTISNPQGDVGALAPTLGVSSGTVQVNPVTSEFTQADMDADFVSRATASSDVLYATNFADVYLDGSKDNARSGMASVADIQSEAQQYLQSGNDGSDMKLSTAIKLSGDHALNLEMPAGSGPNTDGQFTFYLDGRTATQRKRIYFQCSLYMPLETIAWRFQKSGSSFNKLMILGEYASAQVSIGDNYWSGFVQCLLNGLGSFGDSTDNPDYFYNSNQNPFGTATTRETPAIDNGDGGLTTEVTKSMQDRWVENYGVMPRGIAETGNYGYDADTPLLTDRSHVDGWPDQRAINAGSIAWQRDGWTTVEVFMEYGATNGTLQLWAAKYGEAPTLLIDEVGTVEYKNEDNNPWYRFTLRPYATDRSSDALAPAQPHIYDEPAVSLRPIRFPNPGGTGYILPNAQDAHATELEQLANGLSSGGSADYAAGAGDATIAAGFDWQSECHYYAAEREIYYFLKAAGDNDSWELWRFDEDTETLTDLTGETGGVGTINSFGHIYGNSAMNPDTGDLYLQAQGENYVRKRTRSTGAWSTTSSSPNDFSGSPPIDGVAYHPNFYGTGDGAIVLLGRSNTPGYLYAWRESTDTWDRFFRTSDSFREGVGIYNPFDGHVYLGGSNGTPLHRASTDADGEDLAAPPINAAGSGSSNAHGTLIPHPDGSGDLLLIENANSSGAGNRAWKSTDGGATWSAISNHPFDAIGSGPHYVIPAYGVVGRISYGGHRIWKVS